MVTRILAILLMCVASCLQFRLWQSYDNVLHFVAGALFAVSAGLQLVSLAIFLDLQDEG